MGEADLNKKVEDLNRIGRLFVLLGQLSATIRVSMFFKKINSDIVSLQMDVSEQETISKIIEIVGELFDAKTEGYND